MGVLCGMASETTALVLQSCQRVLYQPNCAGIRIQANVSIKCIRMEYVIQAQRSSIYNNKLLLQEVWPTVVGMTFGISSMMQFCSYLSIYQLQNYPNSFSPWPGAMLVWLLYNTCPHTHILWEYLTYMPFILYTTMIVTLQHMVLALLMISHVPAWSQKLLPTCTQGQPHYVHSSQQGTVRWLLRCTTKIL